MTSGTLTLQRYNGEEVFAISSATLMALPEGDQVALNLEIETAELPLKTLPDTKNFCAQPVAEVTIRLQRSEVNSLVGRCFSVPHSVDAEHGDCLSRIYYFEHHGIEDNAIEFVDSQEDMLRVRWTGTTIDVNWYDGSKPPTQIMVDAWFKWFKRIE